ncbi:RidA family protein [Martelella soudanensis]|uniref:RidA family protein n=1 Tax=unclassified Martelella TaxID=2629616 RepID=UPI0015DEB880|nr:MULTISPECIES: RidA family protein [unclassified Martelella]
MVDVIKVKTGNKFEDWASYSRVVAVDNLIFVSNTAGRNPETKEIPDDITAQTEQVLANIERALQAVDSSLEDVVSSRVYVQDPADGDAVGEVLGKRFRGIDPATTMVCPALGSKIYRVEIDVTAYRGAGKGNTRLINLSAS